MKKTISVIDLGSNKIAAAMADITKDGNISLLALENSHSRGIAGGDIMNMDKAVEDISAVMTRLTRLSKKRTKNIFVTTKGADIKMDIARGMVALSSVPREVTKKDMARCLEMAAMMKLPLDRAIIEKFARAYYIDGATRNVRNPVGLYGMKLEAEAFVATANRSKIQNITKCIDHAGFLLKGIYLSAIASADSILEDREKEKGVLLVDIGDSMTEAIVFKNNMLRDFRAIEKGAETILDDNMRGLLATFPAGSGDFSSVVITGGGALLDGVIEKAEQLFKIPTRIGIVRNAGRNLTPQDAIIHTPTIGLINHVARGYKAYHAYKSPIHKLFHKIQHIYESYF